SQTIVIQELSLFVSLGGMVKLTCGLSSGSVSTGYSPSQYQEMLGHSPHMIIYSTNHCLSGVPDPFSGSKSGNSASLTITGLQLEDEADYYCHPCTNR
uniref:Immunoglobulin V-set domain-containing protein n=1 Tax=Marmota marmota marmota TaxID=9994 RepID=A0A8C6EWH3_MARMA